MWHREINGHLIDLLFDVLIGLNSKEERRNLTERKLIFCCRVDFEFYFILIPRFLSNEIAIIRRNDDTTSIEVKLQLLFLLYSFIHRDHFAEGKRLYKLNRFEGNPTAFKRFKK